MNTFTITNKYINTNVLLVFLRWDLCFFFKKKLLANWWGGGRTEWGGAEELALPLRPGRSPVAGLQHV